MSVMRGKYIRISVDLDRITYQKLNNLRVENGQPIAWYVRHWIESALVAREIIPTDLRNAEKRATK